MIPRRAEQEFYDDLKQIMDSQSAEWRAIAYDKKELLVSPSDFAYYLAIRQQYIDQGETVPLDTDGLPIVFFHGIRLKPTHL